MTEEEEVEQEEEEEEASECYFHFCYFSLFLSVLVRSIFCPFYKNRLVLLNVQKRTKNMTPL